MTTLDDLVDVAVSIEKLTGLLVILEEALVPSNRRRWPRSPSPMEKLRRAKLARDERWERLWLEQRGLRALGETPHLADPSVIEARASIAAAIDSLEEPVVRAVSEHRVLTRPPAREPLPFLRWLDAVLPELVGHPGIVRMVDETLTECERAAVLALDGEPVTELGLCPWCGTRELRVYHDQEVARCDNPGCRCPHDACPCKSAGVPNFRHEWPRAQWAHLSILVDVAYAAAAEAVEYTS